MATAFKRTLDRYVKSLVDVLEKVSDRHLNSVELAVFTSAPFDIGVFIRGQLNGSDLYYGENLFINGALNLPLRAVLLVLVDATLAEHVVASLTLYRLPNRILAD